MLSQQEIDAFVELVQDNDFVEDSAAKAVFHRTSKVVLKALAQAMGLKEGTYDIRSNMGGIAVSGEITLHGEDLYVQFSQYDMGILYRSCKGRQDYSGGANQWMQWHGLNDLYQAARTIRKNTTKFLVQ